MFLLESVERMLYPCRRRFLDSHLGYLLCGNRDLQRRADMRLVAVKRVH